MEPLLKGLAIFTLCPLLGGVPLIQWFTFLLTGKNLSQLGTGNISVSAAFYHAGTLAGIVSVLSEAGKGIGAVLFARSLFPHDPVWEPVALLALVLGRYFISQGAGTTNAAWGLIAHDWQISALVALIGGIGCTIIRERKSRQYGILILFPLLQFLMHPNAKGLALAALALNSTLALIYLRIPDDLSLSSDDRPTEPSTMTGLFSRNNGLLSLDSPLKSKEVGAKAANLAYLKQLGYRVPPGWVLLPGDDSQTLIAKLNPSPQHPLVVRSSAFGEDTLHSSAAGQYTSILNVTSPQALHQAILTCFRSVDNPQAKVYRQTRQLPDTKIAVLIQKQIPGVFSGVAFSRDPVARTGDEVAIEALPGDATQIVSGRVTPETYRVAVVEANGEPTTQILQGTGDVPPALIHHVAQTARHIESHYRGIPQDIEWTYDGRELWILQTRPVTTLVPIWTRKIAAEVIPGFIHPLTWSINQPLTCGVWRDIFAIALGTKIARLDLNRLATLHSSSAYFNASLLGEIFLKMGLPPESLEFLTRGAKFSRPPLLSTLKQLPGLLRLANREWRLEDDFHQDDLQWFQPTLAQLIQEQPETDLEYGHQIDLILETLKRATYYSIFAPLSFALRQAILKIDPQDLDWTVMPEVAATRALEDLATCARSLLPDLEDETPETLFGTLAESPDGQTIIDQLAAFMQEYGYLSQVATDISVPRWYDSPRMVRDLFLQQLHGEPRDRPMVLPKQLKIQIVQYRLNLKGRVTQVYSQLLAQLRWSFLGLEKRWLQQRKLEMAGDIFFLTLAEVRSLIDMESPISANLSELVVERKAELARDKQLKSLPYIVYGDRLPTRMFSPLTGGQQLRGIGASPGQARGQVKIVQSLDSLPEVDRETILVVPYTDSGWTLLLSQAGGAISEVGGKLSHGAIVAREYGIPAVMDVPHAMEKLRDGQWVQIDGSQGTIVILQSDRG